MEAFLKRDVKVNFWHAKNYVCFSIIFVRQIHIYSLILKNAKLAICLRNIISASDYFVVHNVWNIN
jgi:hypothetical protein